MFSKQKQKGCGFRWERKKGIDPGFFLIFKNYIEILCEKLNRVNQKESYIKRNNMNKINVDKIV